MREHILLSLDAIAMFSSQVRTTLSIDERPGADTGNVFGIYDAIEPKRFDHIGKWSTP